MKNVLKRRNIERKEKEIELFNSFVTQFIYIQFKKGTSLANIYVCKYLMNYFLFILVELNCIWTIIYAYGVLFFNPA